MTSTQSLDLNVNSLMKRLVRALRKAVGELGAKAFTDCESQALALSNEAVRMLLEEELQRRADDEPEEVEVAGDLHRRHERGEVSYHSLCGTLRVQRCTYRRVGRRNAPTVVPLELEAGLIERATPALAYAVAQGYAKAPSREVEQDLRAAHRCPPSRSTIDRMGKALGMRFKEALPQMEPEARDEERLPEGAHALSLGLDRTTVPMEEDAGKDRVRVHYRMAYVGTVSITDSNGEALMVRRYAAAAHEGPQSLVSRMMADVRKAREENPRLPVAVIQDGAPELWNLIRPALKNEALVARWREAIDRYHLKERLARILEIIEPDPTRRASRLGKWSRSLDINDRAIYRIIRTIEFHAYRNPKRRDEFAPHLPYWGYSQLMHYASLRRLGFPVGSGVTEGACKSLISMRAKRSGQRWRPDGIDAALALRAALHSDRLTRLWPRFARLAAAQAA